MEEGPREWIKLWRKACELDDVRSSNFLDSSVVWVSQMISNQQEQFPVWTQKCMSLWTGRERLFLLTGEGILSKSEVEVEMASATNMETTFNFRAFFTLGPSYIQQFCTKLDVLQNTKVILNQLFLYNHLIMGREYDVWLTVLLFFSGGWVCVPFLATCLPLQQGASPPSSWEHSWGASLLKLW